VAALAARFARQRDASTCWSSGAPFSCDGDPVPRLRPGAGQQPHRDRRCPADERACHVEEAERRNVVRLVHVARGLPQQACVVLVETQPGIAVVAKETTDVAVLMVVVDAEPLAILLLADFADAALPGQHPLVLFRREPVHPLRPVLARLRIDPRAVFRIRAVSQPLLRIELLAVPVAPGAIGREHFFSKYRILGISLLSSFGGAGRHRSLLLDCARWIVRPHGRHGSAAAGARGTSRKRSGEGPYCRPVRKRWVRGAAERGICRSSGNASRRCPAGASRAAPAAKRSTRSC
jgi:hypothetical protein